MVRVIITILVRTTRMIGIIVGRVRAMNSSNDCNKSKNRMNSNNNINLKSNIGNHNNNGNNCDNNKSNSRVIVIR